LGSTLGNSKLALWHNGTARYGFGVQSLQFRFHLGIPLARFSFFNAEAGTEVMTLTGAGNLGIGNTAPRGSLDVAGTGDIWLTNNGLNSGTQSIMMPGHAFFAPFNLQWNR